MISIAKTFTRVKQKVSALYVNEKTSMITLSSSAEIIMLGLTWVFLKTKRFSDSHFLCKWKIVIRNCFHHQIIVLE